MSWQALTQVLRHLSIPESSHQALVGLEFPDDAGVYQLTDEVALVQSVDYFTPMVDDAYDFGRIAAANALSDIYAMGAEPLLALNMVGFPEDRLPLELLADILRGSADVLQEADVLLLGGHSIDDAEPKFGLAVTGTVHPDRVLRKGGIRPGDVLLLTKPLGVGVMTTALKRGLLTEAEIAALTAVMTELNREAARVMQEVGVHAATDVTGFGLLGHAWEMAEASGVDLQLYAGSLEWIPGAQQWAAQDIFPGGSRNNRAHLLARQAVTFPDGFPEYRQLLMTDAITSGGLLIALSPDRVELFQEKMREKDKSPGTVIGMAQPARNASPHIDVLEGKFPQTYGRINSFA